MAVASSRAGRVLTPPLFCRLNVHMCILNTCEVLHIMVYGSTPYVGMTLKKNHGHIKSAQMTHSKCCVRLVNGLHEQYQALPSPPWATGPLTLLESIAKVPDRQVAKTGKLSIF